MARGKVVKSTRGDAGNVIAQNMYAQCDPDGNCCVMFDSFVDWREDDTALCYDL